MKKILIIAAIFLFQILISPRAVSAANFISAQAVVEQSSFLTPSIFTFFFTSVSSIAKGSRVVLTFSPQFDLSSLSASNIEISVNGCQGWQFTSIASSQITFTNGSSDCPENSNFIVTIGNGSGKILNPQPKINHLVGVADIYPIKIVSLDQLDNKIDEIIVKVAIVENLSIGARVSAKFQKTAFILFGYSSPKSTVTIEGKNIHEATIAYSDGYFRFNLIPALSSVETCLSSTDQFGRISSPVCLAPFPKNYTANIGPVLLAPTLSLDRKNYYVDDEIKLSGQSIPNTIVNLNIFTDDKKSLQNFIADLHIVPQVDAFSFPQISAYTDDKGNYSFYLPSASAQFFRLFVQGNYQDQNSPKSNILNLKIFGIYNFIELVILLQILGLMVYLLRRYLHPHVIIRSKALAIREREELMLAGKFDLMIEDQVKSLVKT